MKIEKVPTAVDLQSQPVTNLRDVMWLVGMESTDLLGFFFRSGDIEFMPEPLLDKIAAVISFRDRKDGQHTSETEHKYAHIPLNNDLGVYDLSTRATILWLKKVLQQISMFISSNQIPILFHCFSGKDRTGVVAAALQMIFGASRDVIISDYMSSDGELCPSLFATFLDALPGVLNEMSDIVNIIRSHIRTKCSSQSSDVELDRKLDSVLTLSSPPQCIRLRCGYCPRSASVEAGGWLWTVDEIGRVVKCSGRIVPRPSEASDVKWCNPGTYDLVALRNRGYRWMLMVPLCLSGVDSHLCSIFLHQGAREEYCRAFAKFRNSAVPSHVQIRLHYYTDANCVTPGLQRPDYIELLFCGVPTFEGPSCTTVEIGNTDCGCS